MSDEQNTNNGKMQISVEVDSKTLEDKINEINNLKAENEQLTETLNLISKKEFNARCKNLNLDPANTTPEQLKEASLASGQTATINSFQVGNGSQNEDGYDSMESGILSLSDLAKHDEAIHKELGKVAKRALKPKNGTSFDYEQQPTFNPLTGKDGILQSWRKPIAGKIAEKTYESDESVNKRKIAKKLEQKWKKD